MGDLRIGVSSWADPALIEDGSFYPKKSMTAEARLRWYARYFDTVEINSSYYAIPAAQNALRWAERTPPGFVFNVNCADRAVERVERLAEALNATTGRRVAILGHSPGGHLARATADDLHHARV